MLRFDFHLIACQTGPYSQDSPQPNPVRFCIQLNPGLILTTTPRPNHAPRLFPMHLFALKPSRTCSPSTFPMNHLYTERTFSNRKIQSQILPPVAQCSLINPQSPHNLGRLLATHFWTLCRHRFPLLRYELPPPLLVPRDAKDEN